MEKVALIDVVRGMILLALVGALTLLSGCSFMPTVGGGGPVATRSQQGAIQGVLLGFPVGAAVGGAQLGAAGAAIGAALGSRQGAEIGAKEAASLYAQPQPLPWLTGKKVVVLGDYNNGYGLVTSRPVIEDQLRQRGAVVLDAGSQMYYSYYNQQLKKLATETSYIVLVSSIEIGGTVTVDIRVIQSKPPHVVKAIGSSRVVYNNASYYGGYGYTGDVRIEALRAAGKNAVWALH